MTVLPAGGQRSSWRQINPDDNKRRHEIRRLCTVAASSEEAKLMVSSLLSRLYQKTLSCSRGACFSGCDFVRIGAVDLGRGPPPARVRRGLTPGQQEGALMKCRACKVRRTCGRAVRYGISG